MLVLSQAQARSLEERRAETKTAISQTEGVENPAAAVMGIDPQFKPGKQVMGIDPQFRPGQQVMGIDPQFIRLNPGVIRMGIDPQF